MPIAERVSSPVAGPVWPGSFPDPFVAIHEGRWVAFGTGLATDGRAIPTLHSSDGVRWTEGPGAVPRLLGDGDAYWAPEVAHRDGRWYLYYSVGREDVGHSLRVAVADRPEGPYAPSVHPVLDPAGCPFAIDASPFFHEGRWVLFYSRDLLDSDRPGTALVVAPLDDPLRIADDFHVVARASRDWQMYERGRSMFGRTWDWHTLEGPNCVPPARPGGPLRLLYSGGNWTNDTYGVDWLLGDAPFGEWRDESPTGPRLLATAGSLIGPGHCAAFAGPTGRMLAYHAWDPGRTARRIHLAPLIDSGDGFARIA